MDQTVEKYQQYVITGFVKDVEPVVFDHARDAVIIDTQGREYIDYFSGISVTNAGHSNHQVITGRMFAIEHYGVEPDILVSAKGIANGFPLGGFTTRDEIAAAFRPGDHLSTFGGNPVSCAAALANIEFIENEHLCERSAEKGEYLLDALLDLQQRFHG